MPDVVERRVVEHRVDMRWGDIDSYVHVNNVRYVDYAAEGRDRMVEEGLLPADHVIAGIDVTYLAPLFLTRNPVVVTSHLDGDQVLQEICIDGDAGRIVHARLVTRLGRADATPVPIDDVEGVMQQSFQVRKYDLGADGTMTVERAAELAQEMRIAHRAAIDEPRVWGKTVVAAVTMDIFGAIERGAPDQVARSWVSRVGASSFTSELEVRRGSTVVLRASTVLVAMNPETQGSRPMTDAERAVFTVVRSE